MLLHKKYVKLHIFGGKRIFAYTASVHISCCDFFFRVGLKKLLINVQYLF